MHFWVKDCREVDDDDDDYDDYILTQMNNNYSNHCK